MTGATTAPPGGDGVRVLQLNLCNSGLAGCFTGRAVDRAAAVIRAEEPDVVTLNEVCEGDVPVLERALADSGPGDATVSAFRAAGDRRTGGAVSCRNGQRYGIGIVARLRPDAGAGTHRVTLGGIFPMQDVDQPEQRAWLCVGGSAPNPVRPSPPARPTWTAPAPRWRVPSAATCSGGQFRWRT